MTFTNRLCAGVAAVALSMSMVACSDGGPGVPSGGGTAEVPSSSAKVEVSAWGDGPTALRANHGTGDVSANGSGTPVIYEGRLITASGDCMSVTDDDRPDLVVFPEDTEFDFGDERPSVTSGDLDPLFVGEEIKVASVAVPIDDVEGVPRHCAQGASGTVQVIQGW